MPCRAYDKPNLVFTINRDHFVQCLKCDEIKPWEDATQPFLLGEQYGHKSALVKNVESSLRLMTDIRDEDRWICRDCLRPVLKRAARNVGLPESDSECADTYHESDVFGDMYTFDAVQPEGTSES